MQEFKKRFISFLWTFPYLFIALTADFLLENVHLLTQESLTLILVTRVLQEVGKAARNRLEK
jgi:hypothetical protein